jgi:hypothetical protein
MSTSSGRTSPPVVHDEIALDLVDALRTVVLACAGPGAPYPGGANRGGWKSRTDFLNWQAPVLAQFKERITGVLDGQAIGSSWAIVNKAGSWHGRHRHGAPTSGLYYVTEGDPKVPTIFEQTDAPDLMVEPRVGRLVLFGNLFHYVPKYDGQEPRITIAFDVRM